MSNLKISRALFVLLVLCLALGSIARAEDPRYLSNYNSEYGLKLFHDGKNDLAVERFTKALLLDPQNKTAKESLKTIAETLSAVSATKGLQIERFMDQLEYLNFLSDRYKNLVAENSRLSEFIKSNNSNQSDSLKQTAADLLAKAQDRSNISSHFGDLVTPVEDQNVDLGGVIDQLAEKRQSLVREIDFWTSQNNQLRGLKRRIVDGGTAISANSDAFKSKMGEIQDQLSEKDKVVDTQKRNLEYFQNELGSVRGNYDSLQEKFKSTDKKIADLTKNLAEMSMEIYSKDKVINEKDIRMADLERELNETREKMSLVQRIIQEKDDRIASLEKDMTAVQTTVASNGSSTGQAGAANAATMAQLKSDFAEFQKQFKAEIEKSRDKVIHLETELVQLTQQYQDLSQQIIARDAQIALLDESLQIKDLSLGKYRQAFLSANEKVVQLNDIVAIYRGRLIETQNILRQKNEQLDTLQGTLSEKQRPDSQTQSDDPRITPLIGNDLTFSKNIQTSTSIIGR